MIKKISLLAVTAAAIALALTSCVKAPVSPVTPSLTGTWSFAPLPVAAMINGSAVTVTVGNGQVPISADPLLAKITQVVVTGTLTEDAEENTFTLMLAGDNPITVMLVPTIPAEDQAAQQTVAVAAITTIIEAAQDGTVMIALDTTGVDTMTVTGSFIDALLVAAGMEPPAMGLTAIRVG